jgi:hypothetical protein
MSRVGPVIGALMAYLCLTLWIARIVSRRLALSDRRVVSAGRIPDAQRCLSCGYEVGDLKPCPECGAADPRAIPAGVYLGAAHARMAHSRWSWVLPTVVVGVVAAGYALPLIVGTIRAMMIR